MSIVSIVLMLCHWLGVASTPERAVELGNVAILIASTDADADEAALLAAVCIHESRCALGAIGDGGLSRGAWQVRGRDASVTAALRNLRRSRRICGDLTLYAGCGNCGSCPEIVASLQDPSLPRR